MKKLIVKIGTNVITRDSGLLNLPVMRSVVEQIAALKKEHEVVLVSSGAMAAGRARLGRRNTHASAVLERQVLAAVGQVKLMETYARLFRKHKLDCAQVLATKGDFRDRQHYLCMQECFSTLLHDNIVPIANENDVVSVQELMFTDNDELAGLVASMLNVDALIILTSVDGLFDRNPSDPEAQLITQVSPEETDLQRYTSPGDSKSIFGRGGMHTKCRVAKNLASLGIQTHIVNGTCPEILTRLVAGEELGTTFLPQRRVSGVKKWIAHSEGQQKGKVIVNECAADVLMQKDQARSLLPVGITEVNGSFQKGDIVGIYNQNGTNIGYGVAQYGDDKARQLLGQKNQKALIHYDYLFIRS